MLKCCKYPGECIQEDPCTKPESNVNIVILRDIGSNKTSNLQKSFVNTWLTEKDLFRLKSHPSWK